MEADLDASLSPERVCYLIPFQTNISYANKTEPGIAYDLERHSLPGKREINNGKELGASPQQSRTS